MAQIQRSVIERNKQNLISRIFYTKREEATITAWRSDLDRILHVFEVRPTVHSLVTPLTDHLQTELALQAVSDIREDVADIREDVANTRELVSDVHRTILKDQEGADISNQTVGNRGVLFAIQKSLQSPRLDPGSQS